MSVVISFRLDPDNPREALAIVAPMATRRKAEIFRSRSRSVAMAWRRCPSRST